MTAYITFEEYKTYGGKVSEDAFPYIERKAQHLLDYWTQNRLQSAATIEEIVKETLTEMINRIADFDGGERVSSFSNGKVSFAFDTTKTEEQELYQLALAWLPLEYITGVVDE